MVDFEKTVMMINGFARKENGESIDKLNVLILIFPADRYHLRKFGRMISNGTDYAMQRGRGGRSSLLLKAFATTIKNWIKSKQHLFMNFCNKNQKKGFFP